MVGIITAYDTGHRSHGPADVYLADYLRFGQVTCYACTKCRVEVCESSQPLTGSGTKPACTEPAICRKIDMECLGMSETRSSPCHIGLGGVWTTLARTQTGGLGPALPLHDSVFGLVEGHLGYPYSA